MTESRSGFLTGSQVFASTPRENHAISESTGNRKNRGGGAAAHGLDLARTRELAFLGQTEVDGERSRWPDLESAVAHLLDAKTLRKIGPRVDALANFGDEDHRGVGRVREESDLDGSVEREDAGHLAADADLGDPAPVPCDGRD